MDYLEKPEEKLIATVCMTSIWAAWTVDLFWDTILENLHH